MLANIIVISVIALILGLARQIPRCDRGLREKPRAAPKSTLDIGRKTDKLAHLLRPRAHL